MSYNSAMTSTILNSAMSLPPDERLELIGRLWNSLIEDGFEPPLSPEQTNELERRIARLSATGPQGEEWEVVKQRLLARTRQ